MMRPPAHLVIVALMIIIVAVCNLALTLALRTRLRDPRVMIIPLGIAAILIIASVYLRVHT